MTIREATAADMLQLLQGAEAFITSTPYARRVRYNETALVTLFEHLFAIPNGVLFVAEKDGTLTGGIGIMVYPHPISGDVIAGELFWFSHDGKSGIRLLRHAEQWAREQGAQMLHMIAPSDHVAAFYEKQGFTEFERTYEKELR